jgi:uncharacterized repeat protein (TIGR01451 family)
MITLVLKADAAGTWTDVASVTCAEGVSDEASATTVVVLPTLAITKVGPAKAGLLTLVTYSITVSNPSAVPATSLVVTDTLPAGMSYVSSTPAGTVAGTTVTWNMGDLAPGATKIITLVLKADQLGTWTNVVDVVCAEGVSAEASKSTLVVSLVAFETAIRDSIDPVKVGGQTTYTFNVTNEGSGAGSTAYNVSIWFNIPANTTFVSASGPVSYTYAGGIVTFNNIPELMLGQTVSFKIVVQAVAPSYVLAKGFVTAANYPLTIQDQEGTTIYQ